MTDPQASFWLVRATEEIGSFASTNFHLVADLKDVQYTLAFPSNERRRYSLEEIEPLEPDDPRVQKFIQEG